MWQRSTRARRRPAAVFVCLLPLLLAPTGVLSQEDQEDQGAVDSGSAARQNGVYRIGVEDRLKIHVLQDENLRAGTEFTVRPDGMISFPYVDGEITAAGRTPMELKAEIRKGLADYYQDATVVVIVEHASFKVYVVGEVVNSGVYELGQPIKVVQLLAMAGGLTEFAARNDLKLMRMTGGREVPYDLQYKKIIAGDPEHNIWLAPNDTLVVP